MNGAQQPDRSWRADRLREAGVIAVIRAPSAEVVLPLTAALLEGGVVALEITTTTPDFARAIKQCRDRYGDRALVGAGSILDSNAARMAIEAGAEFLVSPLLDLELVPMSRVAGVPVALGAFTPTEAQRAHESGADFVKLFPAEVLGLSFVKALRAPLPHLRLIPTGGVDARNAGAFRRAGCAAVGVGSALLRAEWIAEGHWSAIAAAAADLVRAWRAG